jgi:hypothetical protein
VLAALVEWLGEGNDFYFHVDAKTDISAFESLRKYQNVFFIEERINVRWGGYSLIEAYLAVIRATCRGKYDYISLISGDTLPLRSNTEIKRFLIEQGLDAEYIIEEQSDRSLADRIIYRYPQVGHRYRKEILVHIRIKFHLFLRKRKTRFTRFSKGSAWFIITPAFRDYMFDYMEHNPWFQEEFLEAFCGDEMFFHMIIADSPFASRASRLLTMYADWHTGPQHPRTLDESDFERLNTAKNLNDERHHFLFARKIDDAMNLNSYKTEVLECHQHLINE